MSNRRKWDNADLLFVGGAHVQVAQNGPRSHFVVHFYIGASIIAGSTNKQGNTLRKRINSEDLRKISVATLWPILTH